MKICANILLIFVALHTAAQIKLNPTDQFTIEGKVKHTLTFSIADLDTFTSRSLPDVVITDHMGVKKHTLTHLKGVLLKDILSNAQLDAENPKVLSEFYFVLVAPDNYKIVYSWNEIFNTETGNNVFIIMEEHGKRIKQTDDRIAIVTITDLRTGRRHMSNISRIIVDRAK
jgi:hypothetical protein